MLANKTRQEIEDFVIGVLAKAAKEGNTNAAGILAGFLARVQASEEAKEHEQRLEEFGQNTPKLAWYFARLGTTEQEAAEIIGRKLTPAERKAWQKGCWERLLEARALELAAARRGSDVPVWMHRKT